MTDLSLQQAAENALDNRDPARTLLLASHVAEAVQDFARHTKPEIYQAVRRAARIHEVMGEEGVRDRLVADPDGARRLMTEASAGLRLVADAAEQSGGGTQGPNPVQAQANPLAMIAGLSRSASEAVATQLALNTEIPAANRTIGFIPANDPEAATRSDQLLHVDPREAALFAAHLQGVLANQLKRDAAQQGIQCKDLDRTITGLRGMAGMVVVGLGQETVTGMTGEQASSLLAHSLARVDKALAETEEHGFQASGDLARLIREEIASYGPTADPIPLSNFKEVAKARLAAAESLGETAAPATQVAAPAEDAQAANDSGVTEISAASFRTDADGRGPLVDMTAAQDRAAPAPALRLR